MERWQIDPYQWTDEAVVVACVPEDGVWRVRTTPTILYPEGGGQPADQGTIGLAPVVDVRKVDGVVVHTTTAPVALGPARITVDPARRFDHMQQHTGQHLLTALLQARHGIATTSFHLGAEHVAIEVDRARVEEGLLREVEEEINEVLRAARPVTSLEVAPEALGPMGVRSRGLPDGFAGRVRLVEIEGVDLNTCGGTHVRHTGELQACVILGAEAVGSRGSRIYFLYGGRVRKHLHALRDHERALHRALSTGDHLAAIERLQADRRGLERRLNVMFQAQVDQLVAELPVAGALARVLVGADARVLQLAAARCAEASPATLVLLVGDGDEPPACVVGPPDQVARVGQALLARCGGKGGGPKGRFQARLARPPAGDDLKDVTRSAP